MFTGGVLVTVAHFRRRIGCWWGMVVRLVCGDHVRTVTGHRAGCGPVVRGEVMSRTHRGNPSFREASMFLSRSRLSTGVVGPIIIFLHSVNISICIS